VPVGSAVQVVVVRVVAPAIKAREQRDRPRAEPAPLPDT
jgi:hypothetical protein